MSFPVDTRIWHWATFAELNSRDLYDIIHARLQVFVVEQNCVYQDCDGADPHSFHLWTRDESGTIAAYLRVVPPGIKYEEPSFGRVITSATARGSGLGKELIAEALRHMDVLYPDRPIRIAAQSYLIRFYEGFGFRSTGYEFLEDGIQHTDMVRPPSFSKSPSNATI